MPTSETILGEPGVVALALAALLLRLSGAAVRSSTVPLARIPGWLLCGVAAWLAAGAAGAFAPVGLALVIALTAALVDLAERRQALWTVGDAVVVGLCGVVSIPRAPAVPVLAAAVALAAAGLLFDALTRRTSGFDRGVVAALPVIVWVLFGIIAPRQQAEFVETRGPELRAAAGRHFAVVAADRGERVELETGAIAWLTRPSTPPPHRRALFFHGSHEDGAYQRGGLFLRRALVSLGFAVLAVDEPGYGASPTPPAPPVDLAAWDPRPTSIAAARYLETLPGTEGSILAVGHSMGATRVLRFLEAWPLASAGVILGATVMPPEWENPKFYRWFLDDYDFRPAEVRPEFVLEVRRHYFNNDRAATVLPPGHAPVLFLRFAFDYSNIIEGRRELFEMIPGRKAQWELRSDHQMASSRVLGVMTGDWQLLRTLREGLADFLAGRSPRNGRRLGFEPR